jgi:uncharacterized membrane protein YheB (UPF0754 family)
MAGKKRNALKHGANATEVMLWSERYEDYESLRAEVFLEFSPSGSTEEYLVRTLLDLRWRRRRLDCHEQITIQKRLHEIREKNEVSRHIENLRALAAEFNEATSGEKVEALLARLGYEESIRKQWPLQEGEDAKTWGPKIAKGLLSLRSESRHEQADEFIAVVDLEEFDVALARIERLDAMIDRTIKRLMQLKTMKQMHGRLEPKLINLTAANNLPGQDGTEKSFN